MLALAVLVVALLVLPTALGWTAPAARSSALAVSHRRGLARTAQRCAGAPSMAMITIADFSIESWNSFTESLTVAASNIVYDRGIVRILDPDLAAFVGGAVGVIGTLESIMARRRAVRERLTCVYCDGAGTLTCGVCIGGCRNTAGTSCANCNGLGKVACVSCQGSGNSVLLASDRNLIRELAGLGTMQGELETEIDR